MGGGSNGTFSWLEISSGDTVYGFRPPLPGGSHLEALQITTQQLGSSSATNSPGKGAPPMGPDMVPQAAESGVFSLYNWESGSWDPLPGGEERTRVSPAARYMGADGLVKLRVSAPASMQLRFILPDLQVEGRVD